MYCYRLQGNRHPLFTLWTSSSSCLLTADLNDAAGGIFSSAMGLCTCHFKECSVVSGLNLKRISRCACSLAEWNQSVLLLTECHSWALRHVPLVWHWAYCNITGNCLRDFHTTTWLNQMLFSTFHILSPGQILLYSTLLEYVRCCHIKDSQFQKPLLIPEGIGFALFELHSALKERNGEKEMNHVDTSIKTKLQHMSIIISLKYNE